MMSGRYCFSIVSKVKNYVSNRYEKDNKPIKIILPQNVTSTVGTTAAAAPSGDGQVGHSWQVVVAGSGTRGTKVVSTSVAAGLLTGVVVLGCAEHLPHMLMTARRYSGKVMVIVLPVNIKNLSSRATLKDKITI